MSQPRHLPSASPGSESEEWDSVPSAAGWAQAEIGKIAVLV